VCRSRGICSDDKRADTRYDMIRYDTRCYSNVRSLTLDGDSHLSTDARWNAVGGDTLVDVIAVARHVLNDHHLAHRTDTCPPTYGHTATCTRLTADIGVPGIGVKEVIHIFKIRRHLSRVYYSAPPPPRIWSAEYCDERVCLSVCLCLCVCVFVCPRSYRGTTRPIFTKFFCMLPMAVD